MDQFSCSVHLAITAEGLSLAAAAHQMFLAAHRRGKGLAGDSQGVRSHDLLNRGRTGA